MKALRAVWGDTRMIVLTSVSGALFAAILIPFKLFPIIPGVTELRPANAIPMVTSLLFGPAGAWGSGLGNLVGDAFQGHSFGAIFGFIGNCLFGYVPFALWRTVFGAADPDRRRWTHWIGMILVFFVASAACAFTIAWGIDVVIGGVPFAILGTIIFFNNFVMAVLLAPPLFFALLPRVRAWGLHYTQIMPAEVTRPPRTAWLGAILLSVGAVGGLVLGMAVATGRYHQPVGIPQLWKAVTGLAAPHEAPAAPAVTPAPAASAPATAKAQPAVPPPAPPPPHRAGLGMTTLPALLLMFAGALLL